MLQITFMSGRFRRYSPARSNGQKDDVDAICNATFQELFYTWFLFSRIWGVLKGLENLHIWILLNFVIEFIGGALWMTEEVSF